MTLERPLPRFVEVRRLARGSVAFYFRIPTYYRKLGCEMANEPLGTGYEAACGDDLEKCVEARGDRVSLPAGDHRAFASGPVGELLLGQAGSKASFSNQRCAPHRRASIGAATV